MTAVQIIEYGTIDVTDATGRSTPGDGQVLVKVAAASINKIDKAVIDGYLQENLPLELPATAGGDFVGTVEEVGAGVTHLQPGERVFGQAGPLLGGTGSLADYTVASAEFTARAPQDLDDVHVAALPLVATSAVEAINTLQVGEGTTILVLGAAGAVGSVAVQVAKDRGATVYGSAAASEESYLIGLGVDRVFDYTDDTWLAEVSDLDAIYDASSGLDPVPYYVLLKRGGRMVSMSTSTEHDTARAADAGVTAKSQLTQPTRELLEQVAVLANSGVIVQRIGSSYPLTDAARAFEEDTDAQKRVIIVA
ncbi:NADP-dependent oxidoreductase [Salinibacterium sp. ZJ450]|uniref:NADP-dependent oxidoreductase n=1 Tax=Salinibacterium sp. ZJ450 TaxID=2708338 RepID=UPI0014207729|nr:NADP-dependent oxidoreductase [Salinibacterium sp. ZJ450]